jgi:23S rRNA pseudouridine1911/1915/1917 synthase
METIKLTQKAIGQRLDVYLCAKLKISRSQIKKQILSGAILINKKPTSVHHFLEAKDVIQVSAVETVLAPKISMKKLTLPTVKLEPKVLLEKKEYLVIEKPAGMLVHPTKSKNRRHDTLVDWLIEKYPRIARIGDDLDRPGIVHRLDREVSGVMIVALTDDAFTYFKRQFKTRQIKKEYLALVYGAIDRPSGVIDFPIDRSKTGKFIARPIGSKIGKKSLTEFIVEKHFINYTYLRVKPLTGRTNQIRVHLSAYNHPIVGDKLYMPTKLKVATKIKLDRIFLHAQKLTFIDPSGEEITVESPLTKNLEDLLNTVK